MIFAWLDSCYLNLVTKFLLRVRKWLQDAPKEVEVLYYRVYRKREEQTPKRVYANTARGKSNTTALRRAALGFLCDRKHQKESIWIS